MDEKVRHCHSERYSAKNLRRAPKPDPSASTPQVTHLRALATVRPSAALQLHDSPVDLRQRDQQHRHEDQDDADGDQKLQQGLRAKGWPPDHARIYGLTAPFGTAATLHIVAAERYLLT